MSNITSNKGRELLLVDAKRKLVLLIKRIVMLEGKGNYTTFHLQGGIKKTFSHCLNTYEKTLFPYGFIRVHRGYIINKALINKVLDIEHRIMMQDDLVATISRRRRSTDTIRQILDIPIPS
jgi:DNA-binding LytR/AlgR family response regulator